MDIDHLSHTQLNRYRCPYRWFQLYQKGEEESVGRAAQLGREVHKYIANTLALDYPDAECGGERIEPGPPSPDIVAEAEDLVAQWTDFEPLAGMNKVLGIEVRCAALLDNLTPFVGYLDCACDWQGMLVIYDWKTGWAPLDGAAKDSPQLASYGWLACEKWPQYIDSDVLLRQYSVRRGFYSQALISPAGRSNAVYSLSRFAERLAAASPEDEWPARPCPECAYCALTCPLSERLLHTPQTDTEAQALAGRVFSLGQQYGKARDMLRLWCETHGEVSAAGRSWALHQSLKQHCPLSAQELVERYGQKAWQWLKLDQGSLPEDAPREEVPGRASFKDRKA